MEEKNTKSKLSLGIALVMVGLMLILPGEGNTNIDWSFENEPVNVTGFSSSNYEEENKPVRVVVPDLSIDLPVEEAKIIGGYWEVFESKAGWGEGSGIPGNPGNQVIFAHARKGLFQPLEKVKNGTKVYVFTNENWYSYVVVDISEVYPSQKEVIEPTEDEMLTLYTCSGYQDTKRLVVTAKRI